MDKIIRCCIFDLGGTIIDKYSITPILSMKELFKKNKLVVMERYITEHMGIEKKQHLEIITFIKDYEGNGLGLDDGTLELEGHFDGKYLMKNTLTRDVKFLNPINGKWENFLLEYDNDSGYRDSINYNYTHHLSDDNFDFSKDFPEEDKLNKALKLHLEYIKKYGKE